MFRLFILVAILVTALASSLITPELDDRWEEYKLTYKKTYSLSEHQQRRIIWESNLRYIRKHNIDAEKGLHTYILGENEYSDMTNKEFVSVMNGFRMRHTRREGRTFIAPDGLTVNSLPPTVDWRTKGYVTNIKNQKACGSCWAFSAVGSVEGQWFKKTQTLVSLSEQNILDCYGQIGSCIGGWIDNAFQYIKNNSGIDSEESYPYRDHQWFCKFNRDNIRATITGYVDLTAQSEEELQMAVASVGPISVAIDATGPQFQHYKSGIYNYKDCSSTELDHAVLTVGYGASGADNYWIIKNSWGTSWGMEGYFNMVRNNNNTCGIATTASFPTV